MAAYLVFLPKGANNSRINDVNAMIAHAADAAAAKALAKARAAEDKAAATEAAAERRVQATKEASNVQQTVNRMPDDDVDRELRGNWTRKG